MKKGKFKNSLFIKIVTLCLLCMIIPMLINLIYTTYSASDALENEASEFLTSLANEKINQVDLLFDLQFDLSDAFVYELFLVDFFEEVAVSGELDQNSINRMAQHLDERYAQANGLYENIFFTYDDNILIDGLGGESVGRAMDHKLEAYYYEQLKTPGLTLGPYMYSPITGRPIIPVVNSIVDERTGKVLSVSVIAVDINKLTEQLVEGNSQENAGTMILDSSGLVLASNLGDQALNLNFSEQDELSSFFENMQSVNNGSGHFTLDGIETIAAFEKHDQYDFYVLTTMPVDHYMSSVNTLRSGIILVIVVSLVVSGIVALLIVSKMVKPIKAVSKAAEEIAMGKSYSSTIKNSEQR